MPVDENSNATDTSYIWYVVSRATAAILGGFVVTYWTGIAVAQAAMGWNLLSRQNAGPVTGPIQLVVYVAVIIGVCATPSMKKAWLGLAVLTALLVAVTLLAPGPPAAVSAAAR
jgi:hypothetical protein